NSRFAWSCQRRRQQRRCSGFRDQDHAALPQKHLGLAVHTPGRYSCQYSCCYLPVALYGIQLIQFLQSTFQLFWRQWLTMTAIDIIGLKDRQSLALLGVGNDHLRATGDLLCGAQAIANGLQIVTIHIVHPPTKGAPFLSNWPQAGHDGGYRSRLLVLV